MLRLLTFFFFVALFAACEGGHYGGDASYASEMDADAAPDPLPSSESYRVMELEDASSATEENGTQANNGTNPNSPAAPLVVRTGELAFTVDDIKTAKQELDVLLQRIGGYYESDQFSRNYASLDNYLTVRFPSREFDAVVSKLESGMGKLERKQLNAKDVSEEYVDVNARLQNSLAYLEQYREILTKTKTVEEILAVREKIRVIQEDIEARKGRLKYLRSQVSMATLTITLSEELERGAVAEEGFWSRLGDSFGIGGEAALEIMIGLVALWPLYLLIAMVVFGLRLYRSRKKQRS